MTGIIMGVATPFDVEISNRRVRLTAERTSSGITAQPLAGLSYFYNRIQACMLFLLSTMIIIINR